MENSLIYKKFVKELNAISDSVDKSSVNPSKNSLKVCLETDIKLFELAINTLSSVSTESIHKCNCIFCGCGGSYARMKFLGSIEESGGSTKFRHKLTVDPSLFMLLSGSEYESECYYKGKFIPHLLCRNLYMYDICYACRDTSSYRGTIRTFKAYVKLYKHILDKKIYVYIEKLKIQKEIEKKKNLIKDIEKEIDTLKTELKSL